MLPLPPPILNGLRLSHEELRALHQNMRIAISAATSQYCLDGPRLLVPQAGEKYVLRAHKRDRTGSLLASVTVYLPNHGAKYTRRIRLVRWEEVDVGLKVEVARDGGTLHT